MLFQENYGKESSRYRTEKIQNQTLSHKKPLFQM